MPLRVGESAGPWMKLGQTATKSRLCCSASFHASFSASTCSQAQAVVRWNQDGVGEVRHLLHCHRP